MTDEQSLKFELLKLLIQHGVSPEDCEKTASRLFEWIQASPPSRPCSTGDSA
jgi:hypothetical protein